MQSKSNCGSHIGGDQFYWYYKQQEGSVPKSISQSQFYSNRSAWRWQVPILQLIETPVNICDQQHRSLHLYQKYTRCKKTRKTTPVFNLSDYPVLQVSIYFIINSLVSCCELRSRSLYYELGRMFKVITVCLMIDYNYGYNYHPLILVCMLNILANNA